MDRRLLLSIIDKFDGGPVGLDTLAAAIGEENRLLRMYEPFLLKEGYLSNSSWTHCNTNGVRAFQPAMGRAAGALV